MAKKDLDFGGMKKYYWEHGAEIDMGTSGGVKWYDNLPELIEDYNKNKHEMPLYSKISCEAIMRFGFSARAADFVYGYFERLHHKYINDLPNNHKSIRNYGKRTFKLAQKINHRYTTGNIKDPVEFFKECQVPF